jgi:hypothetical protein
MCTSDSDIHRRGVYLFCVRFGSENAGDLMKKIAVEVDGLVRQKVFWILDGILRFVFV